MKKIIASTNANGTKMNTFVNCNNILKIGFRETKESKRAHSDDESRSARDQRRGDEKGDDDGDEVAPAVRCYLRRAEFVTINFNFVPFSTLLVQFRKNPLEAHYCICSGTEFVSGENRNVKARNCLWPVARCDFSVPLVYFR